MGSENQGTDPRYLVELGAEHFDPKDVGRKARRRATAGKKRLARALGVEVDHIPGTDREAYLVQFGNDPEAEIVSRFRERFGLSFTREFSSKLFVERMARGTARRVRRDPAVRACIPYWPALKLARSSLATPGATREPRYLTLGLYEKATEELEQKLLHLGCRRIGPSSWSFAVGFLLRVEIEGNHDPTALLVLDEVEWIDEDLGGTPTNDDASSVIQSGTRGSNPIWGRNLHGEHQIIGVIDFGIIDASHDFFRDPLVANPGPTHRKLLAVRSVLGDPVDDHATATSGCAVGDDHNSVGTHAFRGGAWAAKLIYTSIQRFTGPAPQGSIAQELRRSSVAGARVHSMSWAYTPKDSTKPATYTRNAALVDEELWLNQDLLLVGALANNWQQTTTPRGTLAGTYRGAPGTAKNPIGVSATQGPPQHRQYYTGKPGTSDGRRKPDLLAVGESITTSTVTIPGNPLQLDVYSGTSFATPHVAAAAALVRQYFTEGWYPTGKKVAADSWTPSGALLKAMLLNATLPLVSQLGGSAYPSARDGWGRLQLDRTLHFDGDKLVLAVIKDVRHIVGLDADGSTRVFPLTVPVNARRVNITLVFNDPAPKFVGAAVPANIADPVVNKLDLEVEEPPPSVMGYFGNDFQALSSRPRDFSAPGLVSPPNPDELKNNVRQVAVFAPAAGPWSIVVKAHVVDQVTTPPVWPAPFRRRQGYALVACVELN